jgi:hypothetical protein
MRIRLRLWVRTLLAVRTAANQTAKHDDAGPPPPDNSERKLNFLKIDSANFCCKHKTYCVSSFHRVYAFVS